MSYLSNESRKDFHWMERAQTFKKLHDEFGMTYEEIGSAIGLSKSRIITSVSVLDKTKGSRANLLDMETTWEIVNKCPEADVPELIDYAIENSVHSKMTILFIG